MENTESGRARPAQAEPTAIGLVNLWRVSGVAGEGADTWLRLDVPEFQLQRDCGMISGEWRATDDLFLASVSAAGGDCVTDGSIPAVAWLESVSGYRATGDGWVLTGTDGTTIATLTLDGASGQIPAAVESDTEPPPITAHVRAALARPAPLPAGSTPATADDLAGRWVPASLDGPTDPHVLFTADGSWTGSDGCNGNQGRWAANGTGDLLATSGMSTMMFCEGAPVPSWLAQARLAVIDTGILRLLDVNGTELGRLERG